LRQLILEAYYLGNRCRYFRLKGKILILQKKPSNTAEIYSAKKIVQVRVKNESPCNMNTSIRHNRVFAFKTVCYAEALSIFYMTSGDIDFINAVLE